ncbi:MAG TPA: hypothetical protein VFQ80_05550, partial [Thermomicrobiales bacterium]|nr:hypothetical protein [Thermomicrobiales bacterium]
MARPLPQDSNHGTDRAVRLRSGDRPIVAHVHRRLAETGYADVRPARLQAPLAKLGAALAALDAPAPIEGERREARRFSL